MSIMSAVNVVGSLISYGWTAMTSLEIPIGNGITFAGLFIFSWVAGIGLKVLRYLFDFHNKGNGEVRNTKDA